MSDREREPRGWRFYVEDMIGFCERVRDYTAGLDQAAFVASPMPYDATLRNLELIGEAATQIPESVRDAHPENPLANHHRDPQPPHSRVSGHQ